jgi:hypothetical protein
MIGIDYSQGKWYTTDLTGAATWMKMIGGPNLVSIYSVR